MSAFFRANKVQATSVSFPIRAVQWMVAANSQPSCDRLASSAAFAYSSCPLASRSSMGQWERAERTLTEEFYQVTDCSLEMATLDRQAFRESRERQHRAPSPVTRLPHSTAISPAVAFRTKGLNVLPIYWTSSSP